MFIILFFVIMTVYGLLLGRGRVFNILINTYVGYVIAGELGNYAFDYLTRAKDLAHSFTVSLFGAKVLVFAAVVFVLTLKSELAGNNDDGMTSGLYTAGYGFLTAGLMLSAIMKFMGESDRINLFAASDLASKVYGYWLLWLVAPILVIIASNVLKRLAK
jgi:hypothetical protein